MSYYFWSLKRGRGGGFGPALGQMGSAVHRPSGNEAEIFTGSFKTGGQIRITTQEGDLSVRVPHKNSTAVSEREREREKKTEGGKKKR